jgi:hypothetical protein
MRKAIITLVSLFVVGMLTIPGSVSAKTLSVKVEDRVGDVTAMWNLETCDYQALLGDGMPIVRVGFFDMTLFQFSLKKDTFTFCMEMAASLPEEGDPLPTSVRLARYSLWLSAESWDLRSVDVVDYYLMVLWYDGLSYSAELLTSPGKEVITSLSFAVEGPRFSVELPASWMEGIDSFWLFPAVNAFHSQNPQIELWLDMIDPDADVPGLEYTSIPWPPEE